MKSNAMIKSRQSGLKHFPWPWEVLSPLATQSYLLKQLVQREVYGKYKRSRYGLAWIFGQPLLLLLGYTLVFGVFLKQRWGGAGSSSEFALVLFSGLIFYNFFNEVISRSPGLINANAPFVKKMIFPLHMLNWSVATAAAVHAGFSVLVWIVISMFVRGSVPLTILWLPLVFAPVFLFTLGCSWLLSAYGVFHPDAEHVVPVLMLLMMFVSPLFYPIDAIPPAFRAALAFNPLTYVFTEVRRVMIEGHAPHAEVMLAGGAVACLVAWLGLASFMGNREHFADAI